MKIKNRKTESNHEKIYEKLKQKESDHLDICVLYQLRGAILNAPWWMCKDWKGGKKYGV